jgi:Spy/CpxP family protein refolding chaperone
MKTQKIFSVLFLASIMLLIAATDVNAQRERRVREEVRLEESPRMGNPDDFCRNIPNITEEQTQKITELRTAHLKSVTEHRNKIDELKARKRSLMTADNPDMKAIDKVIDEMSALKTEHLKRNARHHQAIRSLLTEEQRVHFDARAPQAKHKMQMHKDGSRRGMGR